MVQYYLIAIIISHIVLFLAGRDCDAEEEEDNVRQRKRRGGREIQCDAEEEKDNV